MIRNAQHGRLNEKIIEFPAGNKLKLLRQRIMQDDLIEERLLTNEAWKALRALHDKREELRNKLEMKVPVEPGYHWARLASRYRRNGSIYYTLVVR